MKIPPLVTLSWSSFSKVSMGNQPTNPPCSGFLPFNGNQVTYEILPQETSRWTSQTMEGAINESLPNKFSPRNLQRLQTRKAFGLICWKISWWFHHNFTSSKSLVGVWSTTYLEYVWQRLPCFAHMNCFVIWGILPPYWALPWTTGLGCQTPPKRFLRGSWEYIFGKGNIIFQISSYELSA